MPGRFAPLVQQHLAHPLAHGLLPRLRDNRRRGQGPRHQVLAEMMALRAIVLNLATALRAVCPRQKPLPGRRDAAATLCAECCASQARRVFTSAVRLLPEIQAMGYSGSVVTLRRFLHSLRPERERLRKLSVRFETPPGQQA